jgi:SAM-dependent methyltransferase
MVDLATIREGWNHAAREDAMFNIITLPEYSNGRWPEREFFRHGRREIDALLDRLDDLELRGPRRKQALDFGCGIGRLTQALHPEYKQVIGVDISDEMIRLARHHNRWGTRCRYLRTHGHVIPYVKRDSCDLIYSRITLQHMPADLQRGYVGEFVQLLAPNGLAVFQIPDGPQFDHDDPWLSMYGVPRATVEEWITAAGGALLDVEHLPDGSPAWTAYRYTVTRA